MPIHDEWVLRPDVEVPPVEGLRTSSIARIAVRRAAASASPLEEYLSPSIDHLHDGSCISGMEEATERIARAIRDGEQILIYGDYDVDGVTSIVLLSTVIRLSGGKVDHVVPHRLFDGYGLKMSVLDRVLTERSVRLVITVDCGISSVDPVSQAIDRGLDVIITDHHLPPSLLPAAAAVLNPKKEGCTYPFKELAGVGVAFKLAAELLRKSGKKLSIESLLKIAAIGTVADVAPLIGENRTIARLGLDGLSDPRNLGLRTLIRDLGLLGKPLRASDVGFKIGPRINAAGRLESADTAIELFSARDEATAGECVAKLNQLNQRRQTIEREILDGIESEISEWSHLPSAIVLSGDGWHKGVLGLCAGKIAQKYHRPTILISVNGDECVGSGRSIGSINLHAMVSSVADHLTHFGGHEFACGLSLATSALSDFKGAVKHAAEEIDASLFVRRATVEQELRLSDLTPDFLADHLMLEPFGAGNRQPLFATRGVTIAEKRPFGNECLNLLLDDGVTKRSAVLWPSRRPLFPLIDGGGRLDVLYTLEPDRYGRFGLSLEVCDAAPAGTMPLRNESPDGAVLG